MIFTAIRNNDCQVTRHRFQVIRYREFFFNRMLISIATDACTNKFLARLSYSLPHGESQGSEVFQFSYPAMRVATSFPFTATECDGCVERRTPGHRRNSSDNTPQSEGGVFNGKYRPRFRCIPKPHLPFFFKNRDLAFQKSRIFYISGYPIRKYQEATSTTNTNRDHNCFLNDMG